MFAAIEAGGTKFVCAVGDQNFQIRDRVSIPTTDPEETLKNIFSFFDGYGDVKAMGIGSFGPIDTNKNSGTYGYITSTPKAHWRNFNLLGEIKKNYNIPIGWTTDVNAACLGEFQVGSASENNSCMYLTVGTGIGGGAILDGKIIEGFGHTEMGHIIIRNHPDDDFEGVCPYHKNCLEGLAAGPSIEKRYGVKSQHLSIDHSIWRIIAYYLAQALVNYTLILRPEKIILGGGVMHHPRMIDYVREEFSLLLAHYVETPDPASYIVTPKLGNNAGIIGGFILAQKML